MIDKYKIADKYFAPFGDPKEFDDAVSLHLSNNEIWLVIAPVYQYWRLQINIDGFFPCTMDKCRKICNLIYKSAEDAEQIFSILSTILSELLTAYQDAGCSLSYIKRMKKNIDYIERLAKDG